MTSRRAPSQLRRNLRYSVIDGTAYMVMVGLAETYFAPFMLELSLGPFIAGIILTVPMMLACFLQLITPAAVRRLNSYRRWTAGCAFFQTICILPLIAVALVGKAPAWLAFLLVTLYWSGAVVGGPSWCSWMGVMIPDRIRSRYFASRNRFLQVGLLAGMIVGGLTLRFSNILDERIADGTTPAPTWLSPGTDLTLPAFAVLFTLAAIARAISTRFLYKQSEPPSLRLTERDVPARELARRISLSDEGRLIIYMASLQFALQLGQPFWHPYIRDYLGDPTRAAPLTYTHYLLLQAALVIGRMIALPACGRLAHRLGSRWLLRAGGFALVPVAALWLASESMLSLLAVQLFTGAALAAHELGWFLMLLESTRPDERTSLIAKIGILNWLCGAAGSSLGGFMLLAHAQSRDGTAYAWVFLASSLVRLATLPLLARIRPSRESPEPLHTGPVSALGTAADQATSPGMAEEALEGQTPGR